MSKITIHTFDTLTSTNTTAAEMGDSADHGTVIRAIEQSAGRGQRGNSWESAPAMNATFSLVIRPDSWPATRQFELSMVISVALCNALYSTCDLSRPLSVKWPNDIYYGDKKLCGILIENSLAGNSISRMIVGIGINVNQTVFVSDAPNPVSLKTLTGTAYQIPTIIEAVCNNIINNIDAYIADPQVTALSRTYHSMLWRNDGNPHQWLDTRSGETFSGVLRHVAPDGMLTIDTPTQSRTYAFKEIQAII